MAKRRDNNSVDQLELMPGLVAAGVGTEHGLARTGTDLHGPRTESVGAPVVAPAPAPTSTPAPLPTLVTPWVRVPQPNGEVLMRPGKPVVQEEEIGTSEAARLLGLAQRTVEGYCDSGVLQEGIDWWQLPAKPGASRGGNIRIKRASVMRLRGV